MALVRTDGIGFQQGQHVCALYRSEREQLSVAADYVADGLHKGERCLYVDSDAALDRFREWLRTGGIDVAAMEASGALFLRTKADAHLADGCFDSERMLRMLNGAVEDALNAGFVGLRTCGDMSWLLDNAAGSEEVVEYEALLNQFFRQTRALGMCQYDVQRIPAGLLDHAGISAHSSMVMNHTHATNPFYGHGDA